MSSVWVFVGVAYPFFGVTGRIGAADEDVVASFGAEVDAAVGVGKDEALFVEVEPFGRSNMVHLAAQRSGFDLHAFFHARQAVDDKGVRSGGVDHNRGVDLGAVAEGDAGDTAVLLPHRHHLRIKQKFAAVVLRRLHQIVGGQLRDR